MQSSPITQAPKPTALPLNPEQQSAIDHTGSPLLIIAGAGSGKTMVLTHKITHLIREHHIPPEAILAITFTNKAAKEMKERVEKLLTSESTPMGANSERPYISTFHAFCGDVLRHQFHHIGGDRNYVIFDASDQVRLMKSIIKDLKLDDTKYPHQRLLSAIERFKNQLLSVEQVKSAPYEAKADPIIADVYERYQNQLWQNRAIDFTDMLYWVVMLFYNVPEVLSYYQHRFTHILVDEYQDTNHAQYMLIRLLTQTHQNLTVVGDFDQNIYSWRGANIENILNFEHDYPSAKTIVLEQNYRSTQTILDAANAVIAQNQNRREKNLWTDNASGDKINQFIGADEHKEARFIASEIQKLKRTGQHYKDMVVLYRVNALTRALEEKLNQSEIPYQIIGGLKFFERKEIKDLMAYLRLIHNPHDDAAFLRIANVPARDIGQTTLDKLQQFARQSQSSIFQILSTCPDLSTRAQKAIFQFRVLLQSLTDEYQDEPSMGVQGLIKRVIDKSGYKTYLENDPSDQSKERLENCYELISVAQEEAQDLGEFIHKVALATEIESHNEAPDQVTLMTLHNAKGLEYDTVFIAGCENGMLPHYRAFDDVSEMEEERRLCYVGITRARKKLYLTSCVKRHVFGDIKYQTVSPFIAEIPQNLLVTTSDDPQSDSPGSSRFSASYSSRYTSSNREPNTFRSSSASTSTSNNPYSPWSKPKTSATSNSTRPMSSSSSASSRVTNPSSQSQQSDTPRPTFEVNQRVDHSRWGTGKIIKIDGTGDNAIIHVLFPGAGLKKLMAKFAPLKIL